MIIPALHERQKARGGYLTDADMRAVAEEVGVPLHRVNAVVSFFPHFRTDPPPKVEVHVCRDMSCHRRGSVEMLERLESWAHLNFGHDVEVCGVSCLGRCDRAPAAIINEELFVSRREDELRDAIKAYAAKVPANPDSDWDLAKEKVGTWDIDFYGGEGQYEAIKNYLETKPSPDGVLRTLEFAGLLGMGGAGGRAYMKWGDVMRAKGKTKYIVCNADESEPGTFKDRDLLLAAPHLTIEGMILAALVTGASAGWIYIRHEYPEQIQKCREEIARAVKLGACGRNIFGSQINFELDVFPSPGGYICGEQTALIEAMENKRGEPRNRPPELATNGLYDQPTLLSNVETFAWVPVIMLREQGRWFQSQGVKEGPFAGEDEARQMTGKRFFSISGDLNRPGAYEVPTGITLGELIDKYCLGMRDGRGIGAVALSGPSGGLLPAQIPVKHLNRRFVETRLPAGTTHIDIRDLPLDIAVSRAVGYMLGAGIVVYNEDADILSEAVANSRFYRNESCGKCVPCRIGSHKITEMGERLLSGDFPPRELPVLEQTALELSSVMQTTSICGLGQVASNPLQSIFKFFPELVAKPRRANENSTLSR
jgi:NADH:ubiquinone oxidoreductase subunit F (NADH-binding)/NADH:ubiquinone oxidoreductase subunit E